MIITKNFRGAWVIYGALGLRQYYGYTREEAIKKYKDEMRGKIFYDER